MSERQRVLVADDDAAIRVLISRILMRDGFEVVSAKDGGEAIEQILSGDFAVIVLDLMMPRIDGFAVVEYLRRERSELLRRVIVTTAYGAIGADRVRPFVDCCMEKPFDTASLAQRAKSIAATLVAPIAADAEPEATKSAASDASDSASPPENQSRRVM